MTEFTDKAPALDMSMDEKAELPKPMYYGNQTVPHPTNRRARITHRDQVLNEVLDAK
jgi:hypothetical protein